MYGIISIVTSIYTHLCFRKRSLYILYTRRLYAETDETARVEIRVVHPTTCNNNPTTHRDRFQKYFGNETQIVLLCFIIEIRIIYIVKNTHAQ